jgi:hypothetical protein
MQFAIHNDGRGGITLTATSAGDAALLASLPETIELKRTATGYGWTPAPAPVRQAAKPKQAIKADEESE